MFLSIRHVLSAVAVALDAFASPSQWLKSCGSKDLRHPSTPAPWLWLDAPSTSSVRLNPSIWWIRIQKISAMVGSEAAQKQCRVPPILLLLYSPVSAEVQNLAPLRPWRLFDRGSKELCRVLARSIWHDHVQDSVTQVGVRSVKACAFCSDRLRNLLGTSPWPIGR